MTSRMTTIFTLLIITAFSGCATTSGKIQKLEVGASCQGANDAVGDSGVKSKRENIGAINEERIRYHDYYIICRNNLISHFGVVTKNHTAQINVESYVDESHQIPKKLAILSSVKGVASGDLKFRKNQGRYVENVFSGLGHQVVAENDAEAFVFVFWNLIDLSSDELVSEPVFGVTNPGSTTSITNSSGSTIATAHTNQTFGETGRNYYNVRHEKYLRVLKIAVVDAKDYREGKFTYRYQATTSSYGFMSNLDKFLPILVAASIDYIGAEAKAEFNIYFDDPAIEYVEDPKSTEPNLVTGRSDFGRHS